MAEVVDLRAHRAVTLAEAWERFTAASARAQKTGDIQDGKAAGAAWRMWLDIFMTADQRGALSSAKLPSELRR